MKNQASKQSVITGKVAPSVKATIIPFDYDNSTEGFNKWTAYVRNELHVNLKERFDAYQIVPEAKKIIQYYKPAPNVRRN